MKHLKTRIPALLLVAFLLVQLIPAVSAYGACSSWAEEELVKMEENNLFPDSFADTDMRLNISRLELCQIAVKAYAKITGRTLQAKHTNYFKDTSDPDVSIAYELGIVSGYPNGTFQPSKNLTRQELFQIIYNLFESLGWTEDEIVDQFNSFKDAGSVSSWAVDATQIMLEVGVTNGAGNNTINPKGSASLQEALTMFLRAYNYTTDYYKEWKTEQDIGEAGFEQTLPEFYETHFYTNVSSWAETPVNTMEVLQLIPSRLNGSDLTRKITREEMCEIAMMAYRLITGDTTSSGINYFKDTKNTSVNTAYEKMIVSGYGNGYFKPTNAITRQELFQIVKNFLEAVGWEKYDNTYELFDRFGDGHSVSSWAKNAAKIMIEIGVVKGNGNGDAKPTLASSATASREAASLMFYRAYEYIELWYSENPLDPDTYAGHPHVVSAAAQQIVDLAMTKLGCAYVYATQGPNTFDCSGLVWWVFRQCGYNINRTASTQWKNGVQVSKANLLPGDLVFFATSPGGAYIGHVGIYIGDGKFLHASNPSSGVKISSLSESWYVARFYGARRIAY